MVAFAISIHALEAAAHCKIFKSKYLNQNFQIQIFKSKYSNQNIQNQIYQCGGFCYIIPISLEAAARSKTSDHNAFLVNIKTRLVSKCLEMSGFKKLH